MRSGGEKESDGLNQYNGTKLIFPDGLFYTQVKTVKDFKANSLTQRMAT